MSPFLVSTVGYGFAPSWAVCPPPNNLYMYLYPIKQYQAPSLYVLNLFLCINDVSFDNHLKTGGPPWSRWT